MKSSANKISKGVRVVADLNRSTTIGTVLYANGRIGRAPAACILLDDGCKALVTVSALTVLTNLQNVA